MKTSESKERNKESVRAWRKRNPFKVRAMARACYKRKRERLLRKRK